MASSAQSPLRERPIQFGKYTLLARIASGGMGELYLAQLRSAGGFAKLVVIKRILSHLTDKPEFVDLFVAEARTAARITHPNVCQIYELGQVDGRYYMALEYLEGMQLAEVMVARKKAPQLADLRLIASLVGQVAEGLHHAHSLREADGESAQVVHRDVNPRNIFITSAGVAKVLDFGIVKVRGALGQIQTGGVKGTYSYLAPEQLQGEAVDCTADIFSLGTITWEAVVGRRLFKRSSDLLTWRAIVEEPIPRPTKFRPDLPPELDEVITRALRRPVSERFQTAREFSAALEQSIRPLGAPLTTLAIAEEMEKAFPTELGRQRERVFAAHRRQEAGEEPAPSAEQPAEAASGPIDDWFGRGNDTRVAEPGYAELVAKMVQSRSQQIGVPVEPLADVSSEELELSEDALAAEPTLRALVRPTAPGQVSLPRPSQLPALPPPPSYVEDGYAAQVPAAREIDHDDSLHGETIDEDEPVIRPRRRWPVVVALALSAAVGAGLVFILKPGPTRQEPVVASPPVSAASVVAAPRAPVTPPAAAVTPPADPAASAPAPSTASAPAEPPGSSASQSEPAVGGSVAPAPEPDREKELAREAERERRERAREAKRERRAEKAAEKAAERERAQKRDKQRDASKRERLALAASSSKQGGFLTINAEPYATLYVDGKKHGYTPVVRLGLPPGAHKLRLVSSSGQPDKKMRVKIVAGQELRKFVKW